MRHCFFHLKANEAVVEWSIDVLVDDSLGRVEAAVAPKNHEVSRPFEAGLEDGVIVDQLVPTEEEPVVVLEQVLTKLLLHLKQRVFILAVVAHNVLY